MGEYRVGSEGGGVQAEGVGRKYGEKIKTGNVRRIWEKKEGITWWGRNRGDVGRVLGEKRIQTEASDEVKGERVSWEESWRVGVSGGGRDVRACS